MRDRAASSSAVLGRAHHAAGDVLRWALATAVALVGGFMLACASSDSTPIQPTVVTLTDVSISGDATFSAPNQTRQLAALATFSNSTTENVTNTSVWQSSNGSVVTVTPAGLAMSVSYGSAVISATYQGKSGTTQASVRTPNCTFALSPSSAAFDYSGGGGTGTVAASAIDCAWTPTSDSSWISITDSSPRTGTGTFAYTVAAYSASGVRFGNISAGGKLLSIAQASGGTCEYTLTSAKTVSMPQAGGSGLITFTLTNGSGCMWTATSSGLASLASTSGIGNISLAFTVPYWSDFYCTPGETRSGTVFVRWHGEQGGENIVITQKCGG